LNTYIPIRLFDFNAKDYYNSKNPLVRILLPKMAYEESERGEVFRKALTGLFQLTSALMFDKYTEFIDIYSGIPDEEREAIYYDLSEDQETAMITQYIKEKGIQQGQIRLLCRLIAKKYGLSEKVVQTYLDNQNAKTLLELGERILEWDSFDRVEEWLNNR